MSAVPKAYQKGLWVHILGVFLPLREFTEKQIKVTRGRKTTWETEELESPEALLLDPRDPEQTSGGIRGVAGKIVGNDGVANPALAGETFLLVEGEKVPFSLVAGMTGKEGAVTKGNKPKARHAKLSTENAVLVSWNEKTYAFNVGISQSTENGLYLWGSAKPRSERIVTEGELVSLSDLVSVKE